MTFAQERQYDGGRRRVSDTHDFIRFGRAIGTDHAAADKEAETIKAVAPTLSANVAQGTQQRYRVAVRA